MNFRRNKRVPKFDYLSTVHKNYVDHLVNVLKEPFYHKIKDICENNKIKGNNKIIKNFQQEMKNIDKWDYEDIKSAAKFVIRKSKCNYTPNLIKASIISGIKFLVATSSRKKITDVEMNIPEAITFFNKCFKEIGRTFYLEPYLICDNGQQPGLRLKNISDSIDLIEKSIRKSLTSFLPYENILEIYLANVDDESSDEEPEQEESEAEESEAEESDIESDIEQEESEAEESEQEQSESDEQGELVNNVENDVEEIMTITKNDLNTDDTLEIIEDENDENVIGIDIPSELNFIPMKSEYNSDTESQPQKEEVKKVVVDNVKRSSSPNPTTITKQQPKSAKNSTKNSDSKKIIFFNDIEDL